MFKVGDKVVVYKEARVIGIEVNRWGVFYTLDYGTGLPSEFVRVPESVVEAASVSPAEKAVA